MKKMKRILNTIIVGTFALLTLIGGINPAQAAEKKKVMTTFYPVYYLAERIGGDAVEVSMLLNDNQDAHDYEAGAKDAAKVQETDLFIYQDDEMEHFASHLLTLIDTNKTKVLKSTEGIKLLKGDADHDHDHDDHDHDDHDHDHDHEHEHTHEFDPHTWLDPTIYAKQAENVRDALIGLDPDNKEVFEKNADALLKDLKQLDEDYKKGLEPLKDHTIVVQHKAFGYLAHAYHLEQVGISGIQTTQEPSAKALAEIQDFVKEHDIKVIYVDPTLDASAAKAVADATGAELRTLSTLESLPKDQRDKGADYLSVMRDNLKSLTK